jgi:WD40 repeat protein
MCVSGRCAAAEAGWPFHPIRAVPWLTALVVTMGSLSSARAEAPRVLSGHTDGVYALAFAPDGKTLASASGDGTARLWDLTTGRERLALHGHDGPVYDVAYSDDGRTLAQRAVTPSCASGTPPPAHWSGS